MLAEGREFVLYQLVVNSDELLLWLVVVDAVEDAAVGKRANREDGYGEWVGIAFLILQCVGGIIIMIIII